MWFTPVDLAELSRMYAVTAAYLRALTLTELLAAMEQQKKESVEEDTRLAAAYS